AAIVEEIFERWLAPDADRTRFDVYPATPLQANLVAQTLVDARAYSMQLPLPVSGDVSQAAVARAVKTVMEAHSILRTRFVTSSGGIYQLLCDGGEPAVSVGSVLEDTSRSELDRGFSCDDMQWFRVALVSTQDGRATHLLLTIHHVCYDGWCLDRLVQDFREALAGHAVAASLPFKRVVEYIESQDLDEAQKFWEGYLGGWEGSKQLALAAADETARAVRGSLSLPNIQAVASQLQVTPTSLAKAAWALTLRSFLQTNDVVFGNVVSGRDMGFAGAA
ncbi:hypothetical protein HDV03_003062, partial [Kappamyces sp. JEL0829]